MHGLNVCFAEQLAGEHADKQSLKFSGLINIFISELPNSNDVVRESVRAALQLMAKLSHPSKSLH